MFDVCYDTTTDEMEITGTWENDAPIGYNCNLEPSPSCFGSFYSTSCTVVCGN